MRNKTLKILVGAASFTLIAEKASAGFVPGQNIPKPTLPTPVVQDALTIDSHMIDNAAQWVNIQATNGIYAQMRAGNDVVIRSEVFGAIAFVSLIIAIVMFLFRILPWMQRCAEAQVIVPFDPIEFLTPLFLAFLLWNPTGNGFAMQNVVVGTNDLLNSFQSYILKTGGKATLAGGSAVKQANAKGQIELSIYRSQVSCSATLDQEQRQKCYDDAFNAVSAQLKPFVGAVWATDMETYADKVLLREGKFANQATNVGSAIGGVVGGAAKRASDSLIGIGTGFLSPVVYSLLLLASSSFGVVIGSLLTLMDLFFPLSIALSFAPSFKGTWVKWFSGIFQVWLSSLFLRLLVTILAIVTVSGSSVSGGLYVISICITSGVCAVMAIVSVITTLSGTANNITNNIGNLR
jgi:hypothetical protein